MPASRAPRSLPPTASIWRPLAVLRTRNSVASTTTTMMTTCTGTPATAPLPITWKEGSLKVCNWLLVKVWAMPRPAMNSTSVATIGWMR